MVYTIYRAHGLHFFIAHAPSTLGPNGFGTYRSQGLYIPNKFIPWHIAASPMIKTVEKVFGLKCTRRHLDNTNQYWSLIGA